MRIVLADSSAVFRMGMRAALEGARDIMIVAEADDGAGVLSAVASEAVDLVVTDLDLPDRSAILLANALREVAPDTRILVVAATGGDAIVRQALLAGVGGYVLKRQAPAEIVAAVRETAAGRRVMPSKLDDAGAPRTPGRAAALERLSAREREIFDLIIWGKTNKQVAVKLGISVKTVETHRSHINGKLQVHSAAELVRLASLCGVLTTPAPEPLPVALDVGGRPPSEGRPALVAKSG